VRTYGRLGQVGGIGGTWVEITTDANGYNSNVYITAVVQALKLNLGESPFYGDYGIPAYPSVMTQVPPDYYASQTQRQFAPYFASLAIKRVAGSFPPAYAVSAICFGGAILEMEVPT
jgi:hypothetical protein